ncbi:zinc finger protein 654 [Ranitomeya imitator]|uniref:zinc finger protein 654 n=1 Tax=Ranitomeya imitator TaxID=111125 RepID=UPI0037E89345
MAEDESDQESERLIEELEAAADEELRTLGAGGSGSREYCRRFCEVVEDYTARWQVPLPQLQVLQTALCCFTSASVSFPPECEHVQDVLSRLALSLFELLLFFGKDEFYEAPLKDILGSVQECHDLLIHYDSVDLRLVTCVIKDGGPWEDPVLQAILKGKSEPQDIVDRYLRSENQLFFEFRVRYLIACERISEAVALITTCLSHPDVSKNLYYHQAYFTCLHMTRLTDKLLPEHVLRIDCSDGVKIICNIEKEGKTALALQLSEAFLITQLQTGKMYCLWDLIFIWSKLQLKVNPSKQVFVEQCYNMLRIATNVKAIFPFMKTIREEIGEGSVQLSVELCGCALQLDLKDDSETKSLIYKTIAYLLPTDLEICRVCALSVFFLERTVESYRVVERLYRNSDEDYNEFSSYVENRVRFELLPILKRGLLFDPEFWNFSMIQTNCSALLGKEAAVLALSNPDPLDNVVEQLSLPVEGAVTPLHNGELKHKESSMRLRVASEPKKNHIMLIPSKMDPVTPRHLCALCNRQFLGGHILRHAQTHHKRGWFSCVMCVRKFRSKVSMLRHLKHHLKKLQRRPTENSLHPSSDSLQTYSNEVNSSEESFSFSETGNSNHDLLDNEPTIPGENHTVDRNEGDVKYSTATQTSFSTDVSNSDDTGALGDVENGASSELSHYIKLNGASLCRKDPVVHREVDYSCPAQGCHRVFHKVRALNKHARNAHPFDPKVQQHIMTWNKGKCRYCQRKFVNCTHYLDHMKMHYYPNVYFCQQLHCNKRYKFSPQLAEHQQSHKTFEAQCGFKNCLKVFNERSSLYVHEAQHYEQHPLDSNTSLQKSVGSVPVSLQIEESVETVPVSLQIEESVETVPVSLQIEESVETVPVSLQIEESVESVPVSLQIEESVETVPVSLQIEGSVETVPVSLHNMDSVETVPALHKGARYLDRQLVRSFKKIRAARKGETLDLPIPIWKSKKDIAEPKTYKQAEKKMNGVVLSPDQAIRASFPFGPGPIHEAIQATDEEQSLKGHSAPEPSVVVQTSATVDDTETDKRKPPGSNTVQETPPKKAAEKAQTLAKPIVTDSFITYGSVAVPSFRRPLPSSYLAEQYTSMPKRWKNDKGHTSQDHAVAKTPVEKFRCGKCLTNYCSKEALEKHLAQKKCQLYFGFDSDDESAW